MAGIIAMAVRLCQLVRAAKVALFRTNNPTVAILGMRVKKPLIKPSVFAAWTASSARSNGVKEPVPPVGGAAVVVGDDMVQGTRNGRRVGMDGRKYSLTWYYQ